MKFSIYIITTIVLYHEWYYYENIRQILLKVYKFVIMSFSIQGVSLIGMF